jgi:hypothetical protein
MLRIVMFAFITGLASAHASAAALCPGTVTVKQTGAPPTPDWAVSYSALPNELEMITFYSGPPKDDASLVYDDIVNSKDTSSATWKFAKDAHGYWVKCAYRGTTLELAKALPDTIASCRVTYERLEKSASGLPVIRSVDCK